MPDYSPHNIHATQRARLIAAAPALLSQLEFAVKLLSPLFGETAQIAAMRDTIAKVKGQAHD